jgi:hypothetical protein
MRSFPMPLTLLLAALVGLGSSGCNAFGLTEDENEVRVTITELSPTADYLVADDGFTYEVTDDTEYEGLTGFADLTVGDVVEIEFAEVSGSSNRRALEIESGSYDDDNPDD